jgi:UDP-glucuronate decarboxylase
MRLKKVLVTGGAGFLGSHLCEKLVNDGLHVVCVDNLYTGSENNIKHLKLEPTFSFIHLDVTSPNFVNKLWTWNFDLIYNLACPASPVHYQKDPIYTTETCFLGAKHVLELAREHQARVVQASTSEIYGDPDVHPQPESYWGNVNPIGPRSCYDEGKRIAETLFFDNWRKYQTNIGVFRIFNTYGPRMAKDDGRVVSNFINQALEGKSITIHGMGSQTRSFCYVDDLIEGIVRFANSELMGPVNLGNPGEFTIKQLAEMVVNKVGSGNIVYEQRPVDDPQQRKPDITKAKKELNWQPQINLSEGLNKTIEYFRSLK